MSSPAVSDFEARAHTLCKKLVQVAEESWRTSYILTDLLANVLSMDDDDYWDLLKAEAETENSVRTVGRNLGGLIRDFPPQYRLALVHEVFGRGNFFNFIFCLSSTDDRVYFTLPADKKFLQHCCDMPQEDLDRLRESLRGKCFEMTERIGESFRSGVYLIFSLDGVLKYVGASKNLYRRLEEHHRLKYPEDNHKIVFIRTHHKHIFRLETFLIRLLNPTDNQV